MEKGEEREWRLGGDGMGWDDGSKGRKRPVDNFIIITVVIQKKKIEVGDIFFFIHLHTYLKHSMIEDERALRRLQEAGFGGGDDKRCTRGVEGLKQKTLPFDSGERLSEETKLWTLGSGQVKNLQRARHEAHLEIP